jgi:hypothetical protein
LKKARLLEAWPFFIFTGGSGKIFLTDKEYADGTNSLSGHKRQTDF